MVCCKAVVDEDTRELTVDMRESRRMRELSVEMRELMLTRGNKS